MTALHFFDISLHRRQLLIGCAAAVAGPANFAIATPSTDGATLRSLSERYFDALLDADPFFASALGLATPEQASRLPISIAPAHRASMNLVYRRTLAALQRVDRNGLDESDRIAYDVIQHHARDALNSLRFPDHLRPIHQGPNVTLYRMASAADNALSAFATVADHEHHLKRLSQIPAWCEQAITNLLEGVRQHIVQPTVIIKRSLPMLRGLAEAVPERNAFAEPIKRIPPTASEADRKRLTAAYREVVSQQVVPAVARLADVVERVCVPNGRSTAGLAGLPGGGDWYAHCVSSSTTTALSAKEIHGLGVAEVKRVRSEMGNIRAHYGFNGPLEEFLIWHDKRPEARPFKTEREVLDAYATLNRRIESQLPGLFDRAPKARIEIRPEPELTRDTASDHYEPPAPDGSRPGVFYAVIPDATAYATPRMTTLFLHEGQPGHHFQGGLAQELPLTRFQRFWFYDAYGEGWAVYAETLGHQLGLYDDPNAYMGHLNFAMLRAARLVVDTGLHDQGWTRERAIQYLSANTGLDERDARAQIERYMVLPGQALSYAVGRMKIESLRDKTHAALGDRFTLATFHGQVLGNGALPLAVLEAKIDRWIAAARAG